MELVVHGQSIKTTAEHPFFVPAQGRFVAAGELQVGEQLVGHNGKLVQIESIGSTGEVTTVYNLRVADFHTYFVGGGLWGFDVWVHNAKFHYVQSQYDDLIESDMQINGIRSNSFFSEDPNLTKFDMSSGALGTGLQANPAKRIVVVSDGPDIKQLHGESGQYANDKFIPRTRIKRVIEVRESGGYMYDLEGNIIRNNDR